MTNNAALNAFSAGGHWQAETNILIGKLVICIVKSIDILYTLMFDNCVFIMSYCMLLLCPSPKYSKMTDASQLVFVHSQGALLVLDQMPGADAFSCACCGVFVRQNLRH